MQEIENANIGKQQFCFIQWEYGTQRQNPGARDAKAFQGTTRPSLVHAKQQCLMLLLYASFAVSRRKT